MTDKEKILKAIEQKRQAIWPADTGEMKPATVPNNLEQGWLNALAWMEKYINSLPAEQPSEDLEKFIQDLIDKYPVNKESVPNDSLNDYYQGLRFGVLRGANWQKEQMSYNAVRGCYIKRNRYTKTNVLQGFSNVCDAIQKFKDGDNVRIIIIKEDEQ